MHTALRSCLRQCSRPSTTQLMSLRDGAADAAHNMSVERRWPRAVDTWQRWHEAECQAGDAEKQHRTLRK